MGESVFNLYASSLYETVEASDLSATTNTGDELAALKGILAQNPDYVKLLSSPAVSRDIKHDLLDEAFNQKLSRYTLNFLKLLVDNGRFASISGIIDEYQHIHDTNSGIMQVTAITATSLDKPLEDRLVAKLNAATGKKIRLNTVLDKSILGGIKLRYDNTEIDATVKTKLDELKQSIKSVTM